MPAPIFPTSHATHFNYQEKNDHYLLMKVVMNRIQ